MAIQSKICGCIQLGTLNKEKHPLFPPCQVEGRIPLAMENPELATYLPDNLAMYEFEDAQFDSLRQVFLYIQMLISEGDTSAAQRFGISRAAQREVEHNPCIQSCQSWFPLKSYPTGWATLSSALLPGSGYLFYERPLTSVSLFVGQALFGLQAWESAHKTGIQGHPFYCICQYFRLTLLANVGGTYWFGNAQNKKQARFRRQCMDDCLLDYYMPDWPESSAATKGR